MKSPKEWIIVLLALAGLGCAIRSVRVSPAPAHWGNGADTSMLWANFVEAAKSGGEPILPDFSYAGYRYSEQPIPTVTGREFSVIDFGAVANDVNYDDVAIQAAIDAAANAGGGVVSFPPGRFLVSPNANPDEFIRITSSNIVLRGSGSGDEGTEILMDRMKPGGTMFRVLPASSSSATLAAITADARRETFWVQVDNASSLHVGQWVVIRYQNPAYNPIYWGGLPLDPQWERVYKDGPNFHEVHRIAEIQGNRVRFNEPLHFTIKMNSAPFTLRSITLLEEVGIEDIRFTGKWDTYPEDFVHHKDAIHDSAWTMLSLTRVANGWVRRCEFKNLNQGIATDTAVAFTFDRIRFSGKKGHTSISTRRGYGTLVKDSEDLAAHHHGPGFGYQGVGTVFLRHQMQVGQRIDSHGGNPYASLIDQTTGGYLGGNGGPLVNYPNHAWYFVFWNFVHRSTSPQTYDFWNVPKRQNNVLARPIFAGFTSTASVVFQDEAAEVMHNESFGKQVTPASLFEAQLALRLSRR
jgi:hypothetical protein